MLTRKTSPLLCALTLILLPLTLLPLKRLAALDETWTPPPEAEIRPSGLMTMVIAEGAGLRRPGPGDRVQVQFTGRRLDGTVFMDSHGKPQVPILDPSRVVLGWREGLSLMVEGEKRRLWVPPELGSPNENEIVVFEVELLRILGSKATPGELMEVPEGAETTESGARTQMLRAGTGTVIPDAGSAFLVEYTGWTRDGKVFNSSAQRGRATVFLIGKVMPAFGECLLKMMEGEKRRCWISEELAQGNWIDSPKGDLLFDIELVRIMDAEEVMGHVGSGSQ